ncbi:MAG: ABC transporter ATP-binding protein [Candidatus Eisenbacteria bacterium]
MWWDDDGPLEEGYIRRLGFREMLSRLAGRLRPERARLGLGVALLLSSVAAELIGPLILRHLIDRAIPAAQSGADPGAILRTGLIYLGVFLIGSASTYTQVLIVAKVGLRTIARLKQDLFDHLLSLGMDHFDRNPTGRLMTRVESDTERLQNLFAEVTLSILRTVILLVGTFAVMLQTNAAITASVLVLALPFLVGALLFLRWMRPLYQKVRRVYANLSTFVTEYAQAVPILQVYGRGPWAMERLRRRNRDRYHTEVRTEFLDYCFWGVVGTLEVFAVILILFLGFSDKFGGGLTLGTAVLFVEYTRRLFWPLALFTEQLGFIQKAFASADRVFGILDTESTVVDRAGARSELPTDWNEIRFENVRFAYDARTIPELGDDDVDQLEHAVQGNTSLLALDGVNFTLRRGDRVALVGPSGGGKTTIVGLLLRFYEPTSGRITIDGVDIREFSLAAWRGLLGLVLQDIHLFPGTVSDNLQVFLQAASRDRLEGAVHALGATDVLARLPHGLETELSEGGQNLSMGERQIVCFARAMVREPELLILDEATSSVDPATESRIQASLERMMEGRTSLVVAHRLSTIKNAHEILVLEKGKIVQQGQHEELLREGGLYRALYDLQFAAGEVA